ncbi:MAG TPA: 2-dehydropantoate 2-reductase [Dokdonella sp.]|uniref:2-dehydropantoate 2-reductase n=1 Tax=Dokdonella sp. TaxID=2291710 RepID=UPI0025C202EB|nr:2-dehydropantoate 2-reductase [Dokdonella sp.]MBX3693267.1 2-dehydropantoate 2-reductase [Dokdonella sp.]MCW5568996.1 2-dehydropantoate 2-reductase [Dokdonella sp.]HNR92473.1 2-dehydropantoate 2-reductase [Dokdonella sp.]
MRALVLGAGGIGGYFGSRLVAAGQDLRFLVRPARAAQLARDGLRLVTAQGTTTTPVTAITAVDPVGRFDLVILSCKAYDLDSAIVAIAPAVGPDTLILPLLNGLRHLDALDAAFGRERVLGGLCHISVALQSDGSIRQIGTLDRLQFGRREGGQAIPAAVRDALLSMRAEVRENERILDAMWAKFAFIAALAGSTCLFRGSVGDIAATPDGAALVRRLYLECAETARCSSHAPTDELIVEALAALTAEGSPLKASMLRDLERGARTETEHILGDLLARAQALGVDTPLLAAACTHMRIYERGL